MPKTKPAPTLRLRRAQESDCRRLWEWANDREVRSVSFHQEAIPWETHAAWFRDKLADANCTLYIAETDAGEPIGQLRFDRGGRDAVISISLDANYRGQGYGVRVLREGCRTFFIEHPTETLHAYIKSGNQASVRAFEAAGFVVFETAQMSGAEALHLKYEPTMAGGRSR